MDLHYVERALCFHGAPMQKIWDNERGADDLQKLGLRAQPNYEIYQQRQRFFTFQDRAKRLKLHQFFARKAKDLYDSDLKKNANVPDEELLKKAKTSLTTLPPYELFACNRDDKEKYQVVLECLKPGKIVYAMFPKADCNIAGQWRVKPICTAEPVVRFLNHLQLKGIILPDDAGPVTLHTDDIVCCEVTSTSIDRVYLGLNKVHNKDPKIELGLVKRGDLPLFYEKSLHFGDKDYEQCLKESKEFLNPNYEILYSINGLDINDTFSMMGCFKLPFPQHEMAKELRKAQAHKWAFRSVAEGIELFKNGHHLEAFQCLNKALSIDPYNVEGLVARGALFANRGSFHKAVDDFGSALKLDKFHANARKYMGETLVALGRSLEEDKRFDEAAKAYKDCLELIPHHVQAMGCLEALNQRLTGSLLDSAFLENLLNIPTATTLRPPPDFDMSNDEPPVKPANSSSSSGDSSSDSDSNAAIDVSANNRSSKLEKAASLSPLSKRMALHAASLRGTVPQGGTISNDEAPMPYNQPFFSARTAISDANDFRLDDDDTQTRVLKLLEQATAHKKDKKKKTKKSKSKKSKKEAKDSQKSKGVGNPNELQQSLFQSNYLLETFKNIGNQNFQNKISMDINSYEQKIADIQKRQELLRQSMTLSKPATNFDDAPPPPPSMNLSKINFSLSKVANNNKSTENSATASSSTSSGGATGGDTNRFSFQIKKAVKVDKFGLLRIATPLKQQQSPSPTRDSRDTETRDSRRAGRSHTRSRTRSPARRWRKRSSRSRSRSKSRSRRSRSSSYRRRRHNSKSRSRSTRRDSRSRHRNSRSPRRRRSHSRSRSKDRYYKRNDSKYKHSDRTVSRSTRSPTFKSKNSFGNRVWQRPGYEPPPPGVNVDEDLKSINQRWQHDKFEEINSDRPGNAAPNATATVARREEGPSIEEIDEIIKKAQKERKEEIIKRDNEILKRPNNGRF